MSHFTVLVPAQNQEELEAVLLPYHEYECTGIEAYTEFVIEHTAEHAEEEARKIVNRDYVQENEQLKPRYDTWLEGGNISAIFEDWDGLKLDEHGNIGRKTNPNAKWDWWSIGGRWTGMLKLKMRERFLLRGEKEIAGLNRNEVDFLVKLYLENHGKFEQTVAKYQGKANEIRAAVKQIADGPSEQVGVRPEGAENGRPGLMTPPNEDHTRADTAYIKDVDWEGILDEQLGHTMKTYRAYQDALTKAKLKNVPSESLEKATETWNDDGGRGEHCRAAYESLEDYALSCTADQIMMDNGYWLHDTFQEAADRFYKTEDEYHAMFSADALTYAFIDLEGKWNQRGEMGWWGMSDKNQGTPDYDKAFWVFVKSLSPDQRVYVVDCHI